MIVLRAILTLALSATLPSQAILWEQVGVDPSLWRGGPSVALDDVNGDGYGDWITEVAVYPPNPSSMTFVMSGRDGATLRTNTFGGPFFSAGDWNGDGILDYVSRGSGGVQVVSGFDDSVLQGFPAPSGAASRFGATVAGNLDVTGDGLLDLVVGNAATGSQQVHVYDHYGRELYRISTHHWTVGSMDDLDGDGCDEFLIGRAELEQGRGEVLVCSGRTGQVVTRGYGDRPLAGLGLGHVMGCGDVDADGLPDFVASSDGFAAHSNVRVFAGTVSSPVARPIYNWSRGVGTSFGGALAVGDLDLDGMPDLLVGSLEFVGNTGGTLYWYSLRDGSLVRKMLPLGFNQRSAQFGSSIAIGKPHPDNPFPVFITGEPFWQATTSIYPALGRVTLFRSAPESVSGLGEACAGSLDEPPLMGLTARPQHPVRIHLSGAPAGAQALLLLGTSNTHWHGAPLPISLSSPFGLPGCQLYTSVDLVAAAHTGTTGNNAGYAFVDLPLPIASAAPQLTVHGQWMVLSTSGTEPAAMSNGLSWGH